jgi:hypothetical protein
MGGAIAVAVLVSAVTGGIWRRVLGGWGGYRRSFIFVCGALLTWPLWLVLPPLYAVVAGGLCLLFWAPGHQMEDDRAMWLRYGPFAVGWIAARHLKIVAWTVVGELVAGFLFWGTVTAISLWSI